MSRRRKLGRVTRDRWFESGLLQRRVCELLVPKRRSPIDNASSKDKFVPQVEQRRFLSFRPSGASRRAAIGGGAVTRGSCLAAMDHLGRGNSSSCPLRDFPGRANKRPHRGWIADLRRDLLGRQGRAERSHGRLASNLRSWRVRLLTHPLWRRRWLKTHPGLRRPLSAPILARSLYRWNCHAESG
jgi:hypothetical protein